MSFFRVSHQTATPIPTRFCDVFQQKHTKAGTSTQPKCSRFITDLFELSPKTSKKPWAFECDPFRLSPLFWASQPTSPTSPRAMLHRSLPAGHHQPQQQPPLAALERRQRGAAAERRPGAAAQCGDLGSPGWGNGPLWVVWAGCVKTVISWGNLWWCLEVIHSHPNAILWFPRWAINLRGPKFRLATLVDLLNELRLAIGWLAGW